MLRCACRTRAVWVHAGACRRSPLLLGPYGQPARAAGRAAPGPAPPAPRVCIRGRRRRLPSRVLLTAVRALRTSLPHLPGPERHPTRRPAAPAVVPHQPARAAAAVRVQRGRADEDCAPRPAPPGALTSRPGAPKHAAPSLDPPPRAAAGPKGREHAFRRPRAPRAAVPPRPHIPHVPHPHQQTKTKTNKKSLSNLPTTTMCCWRICYTGSCSWGMRPSRAPQQQQPIRPSPP